MGKEIEGLMSLEVCENCPREWCDFFAPGIGENGASYSRRGVQSILDGLPALEKHLTKILNATPTKGKDK